MTPLLFATELASERPPVAAAAAVAVAIATAQDGSREDDRGVLLVELGSERARGPTMLASQAARALETRLRDIGLEASARGRLAWLRIDPGDGWAIRLAEAIAVAGHPWAVVVAGSPASLREALASDTVRLTGVLVRAELPRERALAALAVVELRDLGLRVRILAGAPGRVASRRALAGIEPGGELGRRTARIARGLLGCKPVAPRGPGLVRARIASEGGQALPLVLGGAIVLIFATILLASLGGAATGKSRVQRAADLAALSAARSMRDDFDRLFEPAERLDGSPNPRHLAKPTYLKRAAVAAVEAAERNGVDRERLEVEWPDLDSFAPMRVRAEVGASLDAPSPIPDLPVEAEAEAEAVPPAGGTAGPLTTASGGGYSGPLATRQGQTMRPDVAAAFDRMEAAARADGVALIVNSGFRSDAEQAELFAANPDPRWVAPPGTSLHRCATELDLGPPSAHGWLASNAGRFGFVQRYSWEPWHYGFADGPPPCSAAGDRGGTGDVDGAGEGSAEEGTSLPSFVPARFREPLARSASRWNVSAALLAAQLMAESNFNPFAVSSVGARGIAQFMPATAAAYGLDDPMDPEASIDAQAHLMSDLLRQFDGQTELALAAYNAGPAPVEACGCVPGYPETQAYVARIMGLMGGAGALATGPTLEVRLVD